MIGEAEIKEMQEHIAEMEREIAAKKKALRDAKYAGLHAAMQARKEADEAVKQELKELGIKTSSLNFPLDFYWKF
jgi:aspartate aminotransferase-like enzyme